MTKSKNLTTVLLETTVKNLAGVRKVFVRLGRPMSNIRKIDDAIDAINQVIKHMETK